MLTAFLGFGFWAISCYALLALFGMTDGDDDDPKEVVKTR